MVMNTALILIGQDNSVEDIKAIPSSQPHREVDLA